MNFAALSAFAEEFMALRSAVARRDPHRNNRDRISLKHREKLLRSFIAYYKRENPRLCRGGSRTLRIPGVCPPSNCLCCGNEDSSTRFLLLFLLLLWTVAKRPL
jgi:hypothetical protein